jgi:hypothetical protein
VLHPRAVAVERFAAIEPVHLQIEVAMRFAKIGGRSAAP